MRFSFIFLLMFCSQLVLAQTDISHEFKEKVTNISKNLTIVNPQHSDPVSVASTLVWNETKDQLAIVVKASILNGWHIYALVPENQPYIKCDLVLNVPKGLEAITDWEMPSPFPYESEIYVYKGELVFTKFFKVTENIVGDFEAGLFYQTCDINQCLPPQTKVFKLKM